MKELKVSGYNLSYSFDKKNREDVYLQRFFVRLKARLKTHSADSLAREDVLLIANIPFVDEQPYHIKGNNKICLNVPAEHAERAKLFFDKINSEAYKLGSQDNEPSNDRMRQFLTGTAKKAEVEHQKIIQKRIEQEAIAKQKDKVEFRAPVERRHYRDVTKDVLEMMTTQTAKDWFIPKFHIEEPDAKTKERIKNKHNIENTTIFDVNLKKCSLYFSCPDLDADLAKIFLQKLEAEVETGKLETADWNTEFDRIYEESVHSYQQMHNSKMQTLEVKKKGETNSPGNLVVDWTSALDEPIQKVEHFKVDTNRETKGFHNVLIAESRHAQCVYNSLYNAGFAENLEYYFEDKSFSIKKDSNDRPTFRISSKIDFADAKFNTLKNILNGMVLSNHAPEFSREKIKQDIKKSVSEIESAIQQNKANQEILVQESQKKRERDNNFTVRHTKNNKAFFVHLNEPLDKNNRTRLDGLKNLFKLDYVKSVPLGLKIGSKSAQVLSEKQEEFKGFVLWMAEQNSPEIQKEINAARFVKPLEVYRAEKDSEARQKREDSYKEFIIPEISKQIIMLDAEQVQANRNFNEKCVNILLGPAGTGKTFVAAACSINALLNKNNPIKQIVIARPDTAVGGKEKAFLPGDVVDKLRPLLGGFFDNFNEIFEGNEQKFKELFEGGKDDKGREIEPLIVVQDIDYIRGRSFKNTIMIVDESQNLLQEDIDVIKTRIGFGSKLIFTADISDNQTDVKKIFGDGVTPPFKHFVLKYAFAQDKDEITKLPKNVQQALDMIGITQLTTVRRSQTVQNFIVLDDYFSKNKGDITEVRNSLTVPKTDSSLVEFGKKWIKPITIRVS